jgi:hypothetical protein
MFGEQQSSSIRTEAEDTECLVEIDLGNGTLQTLALNCISVELNRPDLQGACKQLNFK